MFINTEGIRTSLNPYTNKIRTLVRKKNTLDNRFLLHGGFYTNSPHIHNIKCWHLKKKKHDELHPTCRVSLEKEICIINIYNPRAFGRVLNVIKVILSELKWSCRFQQVFCVCRRPTDDRIRYKVKSNWRNLWTIIANWWNYTSIVYAKRDV